MTSHRRSHRICRLSRIWHVGCAFAFLVLSGGATGESPPAVVAAASASGSQGWTLDGSKFTARAGTAVSGDCDINGDGYSDLLIGAPGAGTQSEGVAFVVFGTVSGVAPPPSLNDAGLKLIGEDTSDATGASVACAGDVNGDGFEDVLIGAPFASDPVAGVSSGVVFLVYGGDKPPATIDLATLNGSDGMRINGIVNGQRLGAVVAWRRRHQRRWQLRSAVDRTELRCNCDESGPGIRNLRGQWIASEFRPQDARWQ
jgi:hypothetical protein